ncbi:hypothetical protein ACFQX6_08485 [Streptosporangium lutulentum]
MVEELGLDRPVGRVLAVDWIPSRPGWPDGLILLYDGGVLTAAEIAAIRLPADELAAWAFVDPDEVPGRVAAPLGSRSPPTCGPRPTARWPTWRTVISRADRTAHAEGVVGCAARRGKWNNPGVSEELSRWYRGRMVFGPFPPFEAEEAEILEREIGASLPAAYRRFLEAAGGSHLEYAIDIPAGEPDSETLGFNELYRLGRGRTVTTATGRCWGVPRRLQRVARRRGPARRAVAHRSQRRRRHPVSRPEPRCSRPRPRVRPRAPRLGRTPRAGPSPRSPTPSTPTSTTCSSILTWPS